jgi:hypothetical protein
MPIEPKREARIRRMVAHLMNEALRTAPIAPEDGKPFQPDDVNVWEIISYVRNATITEFRDAVEDLRH